MNRKGNMGMVGVMLMTFMGVIIGLILVGDAIFPTVGQSTTLSTLTNASITVVTPGVLIDLPGKHWSSVTIRNATGTGALIDAGNYTILNNQIDATTGELTAQLNASGERFSAADAYNVSGTVQPYGYIPESGGRSIALLIAVFSALAIVVIALAPTLKERFF